MGTRSGYRELEHTADWVLQVWAPDIVELFIQAAEGMYVLAGISLRNSERKQRKIALTSVDEEALLVAFLNELLYISEMESIAFDHFELTVEDKALAGVLYGTSIASIQKEIKAVTFHGMQIRDSKDGFVVDIVLDV